MLVSTTRPALNAVAIVPRELDGATCSTGLAVLRSDGRILPRYLWYWTQTQDFIRPIERSVSGALYPAVSDAEVLEQAVPLPSLKLQTEAVRKLDAEFDMVARIAPLVVQAPTFALPAALLRRAFEEVAA